MKEVERDTQLLLSSSMEMPFYSLPILLQRIA